MKPGQKRGRKEPCWCGSGIMYKSCHYPKDREDWKIQKGLDTSHFSIHQRNVALIDAVSEIFGLKASADLEQLRRTISGNQVRELYEFIEKLWPAGTDLSELLPEEKDHELTAFYLGDIRPDLISRNLMRFALYSDRILMIDPFLRTELFGTEIDPLNEPDAFKTDTLKLISFLLVVKPLVVGEIITLIPHPGLFDKDLHAKTVELARNRLSKHVFEKEAYDDFAADFIDEYGRILAQFPQRSAVAMLRRDFPSLLDSEIEEILSLTRKMRQEDPLVVNQEPRNSGSTVWAIRTGVNLELAMYISQITGAFPYTSRRTTWNEILSATDELSETARIWSPLTKAFQAYEFKFLDRVDPAFLFKIRNEENRLGGFRSFLRDLWKQVGGNPEPSKMESTARDFVDRLKMEKSKMEGEWAKIDQDLLKWLGASGSLSFVAECVLTGQLSFSFSGAGLIIHSIVQLLLSRSKRKSFRKSHPMSVFLDLAPHRNR
jgi:hypothetical protein